jgi:hypothetical protein
VCLGGRCCERGQGGCTAARAREAGRMTDRSSPARVRYAAATGAESAAIEPIVAEDVCVEAAPFDAMPAPTEAGAPLSVLP